MSRTKGSKNKVAADVADRVIDESNLHESYHSLVVSLVRAIMSNPNVYPRGGDQSIIAMAKRMADELSGH